MRVFIPSLGRPQHVPPMLELAGGATLVWLVPEPQREAYLEAGAEEVITGHPRQFAKMNEVLDLYPDEWVVFSDDDCQGLLMLDPDGVVRPTTFAVAAEELVRVATARRDQFACISMNQNQRFMHRSVSDWAQPSNWLCAIAPGLRERWVDGTCADVEFGARITSHYGRISRVNYIIGMYRFGGPTSYYYESHLNRGLYEREVIKRYPHLLKWDAAKERITYRRLPRG